MDGASGVRGSVGCLYSAPDASMRTSACSASRGGGRRPCRWQGRRQLPCKIMSALATRCRAPARGWGVFAGSPGQQFAPIPINNAAPPPSPLLPRALGGPAGTTGGPSRTHALTLARARARQYSRKRWQTAGWSCISSLPPSFARRHESLSRNACGASPHPTPPICAPGLCCRGSAIVCECVVCAVQSQDEPAYCGLSTLVMTLNALSIDPHRSVCSLRCCAPCVCARACTFLCETAFVSVYE